MQCSRTKVDRPTARPFAFVLRLSSFDRLVHGDALDNRPPQSRCLDHSPPLSHLLRGPNVSYGDVVKSTHDPRRPGLLSRECVLKSCVAS